VANKSSFRVFGNEYIERVSNSEVN